MTMLTGRPRNCTLAIYEARDQEQITICADRERMKATAGMCLAFDLCSVLQPKVLIYECLCPKPIFRTTLTSNIAGQPAPRDSEGRAWNVCSVVIQCHDPCMASLFPSNMQLAPLDNARRQVERQF